MVQQIILQNQYRTLDELEHYLNSNSNYSCYKDYDIWDHRINAHGQFEQCLILKKGGLHAIKMHFDNDNFLSVKHIIPSKLFQALLGKSVKAKKNIFELVLEPLKQMALRPSQQKGFKMLLVEISDIIA